MTAPAAGPRQDALELDVVARSVDDVVGDLLGRIASDQANELRLDPQAAAAASTRTGSAPASPTRPRGGPALGEDRAQHPLPLHRVGAVIAGLVRAGALHRGGWGTNDDARSRNAGKPLRLYVLAEDLRAVTSRGAS